MLCRWWHQINCDAVSRIAETVLGRNLGLERSITCGPVACSAKTSSASQLTSTFLTRVHQTETNQRMPANRHGIEACTLVEQISPRVASKAGAKNWVRSRPPARERRAYKYPRATFAKIPHRFPCGFYKTRKKSPGDQKERNHLLDGIIGKARRRASVPISPPVGASLSLSLSLSLYAHCLLASQVPWILDGKRWRWIFFLARSTVLLASPVPGNCASLRPRTATARDPARANTRCRTLSRRRPP